MPGLCKGQAEKNSLLEQIMEYVAENIAEDQDYSGISERLEYYLRHPMDINKAKREELEELGFITPIQINNLIVHRRESGMFQDLLELQSVEGFDIETTRWLSNFMVVNPPQLLSGISLNKIIGQSNHELMIRFGRILQQQKGFLQTDSSPSVYVGSPFRIFTRYRFHYANKLLVSLNMEKDAGEPFFNRGQGFDFYSANISMNGDKLVKKIVLGDYVLQYGQGLSMWSGLGFGKGVGLTTVAKHAGGLRPYSSVNESSFLRGISASFGYRGLSFTPFFSYKTLDATLSGDESEINSFALGGLHRTVSERRNKNSARQLAFGINSVFNKGDFTAGFTAYRTSFDKSVAKGMALYERFDFDGKALTNAGIHYSYTFRNTYFFGEGAHSFSTGSAFLCGLMSSLSSQLSGVLLYRNYARNYHSFFNQGLAESTTASNEKGLYTGMNLKFNTKLELSCNVDFFRFPWFKFRVDGPSQGHELLTQLTYSFNKNLKVAGRFRLQQKEENSTEDNFTGGLEVVQKQNYRIELNYRVSNSFSLRNRAELSTYTKGRNAKEFGFLSYQDVIYNPLNSKFSGNMRFAVFDTGGFNSRIYAFENDVLYAYSVPAYQGRGMRCYLNGRYTPGRGVDVWLRYALLNYSEQETVGSGNDMISGNRRSEVKVQLRFQF